MKLPVSYVTVDADEGPYLAVVLDSIDTYQLLRRITPREARTYLPQAPLTKAGIAVMERIRKGYGSWR